MSRGHRLGSVGESADLQVANIIIPREGVAIHVLVLYGSGREMRYVRFRSSDFGIMGLFLCIVERLCI